MPMLIEGEYKQGRIELFDPPAGLREGRVRVVLIEEPQKETGQRLSYGKYAGGRMSTEDDFRLAEWRGDEELSG